MIITYHYPKHCGNLYPTGWSLTITYLFPDGEVTRTWTGYKWRWQTWVLGWVRHPRWGEPGHRLIRRGDMAPGQ